MQLEPDCVIAVPQWARNHRAVTGRNSGGGTRKAHLERFKTGCKCADPGHELHGLLVESPQPEAHRVVVGGVGMIVSDHPAVCNSHLPIRDKPLEACVEPHELLIREVRAGLIDAVSLGVELGLQPYSPLRRHTDAGRPMAHMMGRQFVEDTAHGLDRCRERLRNPVMPRIAEQRQRTYDGEGVRVVGLCALTNGYNGAVGILCRISAT